MVAFNSAIVFCASASISARSRFHCRRSSESTFRNSLQSIGLLCLEARFPRGAFFGELRPILARKASRQSIVSQPGHVRCSVLRQTHRQSLSRHDRCCAR
jgi:hypothetical protein